MHAIQHIPPTIAALAPRHTWSGQNTFSDNKLAARGSQRTSATADAEKGLFGPGFSSFLCATIVEGVNASDLPTATNCCLDKANGRPGFIISARPNTAWQIVSNQAM